MSLVGYDYSDDEDEQELLHHETPAEVKESNGPNETQINSAISFTNGSSETAKTPSTITSGLSQLPPVQSISSTLSKDAVKRAVNGRIQITVPQLLAQVESDDSEDEEERQRKKFKRSDQGSRLISMLPKPKQMSSNSALSSSGPSAAAASKSSLTSLIPASVANRSKNPISDKPSPSSSNKGSSSEKQPSGSSSFFFTNEDDDDDDEDDFKIPTFEDQIKPSDFSTFNSASQAAPDVDAPVFGPAKPVSSAILTDSLYSPIENEPVMLDPNQDVTYKKFIASKFGDESAAADIKFVDFDMSKHLSQNTDWLKNITVEKEDRDEEESEGNTPNSTARRKNQITFLAYQAKKRETELKNQWAQNRVAKNQTRAKYGF